jgi:hypothetical protein
MSGGNLWRLYVFITGLSHFRGLTCQYRINSSEFDTPETDCFTADSDSSFGKEVFNIAMAQVETIVEPDSVADDVWSKSVAFVCIHSLILSVTGF